MAAQPEDAQLPLLQFNHLIKFVLPYPITINFMDISDLRAQCHRGWWVVAGTIFSSLS
jgi:hypothetical protein